MNAGEEREGLSACRHVIPAQCVRVSGEPARVPVPGVTESAEPKVELIRQGDVVQAIDITCSCGERIRLKCVYS